MRGIAVYFTACLTALFVFLNIVVADDSVKVKGVAEREETHQMEMQRPTVDGLKEFHNVLRPVWHTFLPASDYKAVREAVPMFRKTADIILKAELPEYYQHVKTGFELKRRELGNAVLKLDSVAQGTDNILLEKAVENMHTAFEQLARILAPRMQEIERFHLVLYPLWHEALPQSDWEAVKTAAPNLRAKMDSLMAAAVPEWFKDKEPQILEKRAALDKAVNELVITCEENKDKEIKEKLTLMHEYFRALDEVFE
jgi:hypothetical protein